jgi:two-component system, NarL family, nitrate/nitrite response regulator NarL
MQIKLLLCEDSKVVRDPLVRMLSEQSSINLVGVAETFTETLELASALKPDLVLMDVHMPDDHEYDAAEIALKLRSSAKRILAMSFWKDERTSALAKRLGADALLDKTELGSELIPAILQTDFAESAD